MTPLFVSYVGNGDDGWRVMGYAVVPYNRPVAAWKDLEAIHESLRSVDGVPSNATITGWRRMEDPA